MITIFPNGPLDIALILLTVAAITAAIAFILPLRWGWWAFPVVIFPVAILSFSAVPIVIGFAHSRPDHDSSIDVVAGHLSPVLLGAMLLDAILVFWVSRSVKRRHFQR